MWSLKQKKDHQESGSSVMKIDVAGHFIDASRIIFISPIYKIGTLQVYTIVFENNVELKLSDTKTHLNFYPRKKLIELWKAI